VIAIPGNEGERLAANGGPTTPGTCTDNAHTHASIRIGIHESSAVLAKIENNGIASSHVS